MPSARAYPLEALMADCIEYFRSVPSFGAAPPPLHAAQPLAT